MPVPIKKERCPYSLNFEDDQVVIAQKEVKLNYEYKSMMHC